MEEEKKYTAEEILEMLNNGDLPVEKVKKQKKKMKTGKKALRAGVFLCSVLIIFAMVMVFIDKDTTSNAIFASAGVVCITVMFGIYEKFSTDISLKHMEENYIPDYDEKKGLY